MRQGLERLAVSVSSYPATSRIAGRLADLRLPGPLLLPILRLYCRAYGVDTAEAAKPLEAFESFDAFFTRRLRDGARPVDETPGVVVSPCDARLATCGTVPSDGLIEQVKGHTYSVEALLGSADDARIFAGGAMATLYLSPAMYHRVHSPVAGRVRSWRYVPGRLYPVNTMGVRHVEGLFAKNERVAVLLDTEDGPVAVVLVGAANVGRMTLAFADLVTNRGLAGGEFTPAQPVELGRGEELGAFHLGSTVVLLVANSRLTNAGPLPGQVVRMGQALWRTA